MWDFRMHGSALPECEVPAATTGCHVRELVLDTPTPRGVGRASLSVFLHGASEAHHLAQVSLNGARLGTVPFHGLLPVEHAFDIDARLLRNGRNVVHIDAVSQPDAKAPSVFYIDRIEAEYQRRHVAADDRIEIPALTRGLHTVRGFSGDDIAVLDLANPRRPRMIRGSRAERRDNDSAVTFRLKRPRPRPVLVTRKAAALAPVFMRADKPSALRERAHKVDWLLITTAALEAPALRLAHYRSSQGLRTKVVDIEDIYDEFNGGIVNADAIWSMLKYAHDYWAAAPRYVVLAGEGSYDYKNHLGHGDSLVPALLTPTPVGLAPSDALLADVVGNDRREEMAIGRLPVIDEAEFDGVVSKLIAYEAGDGAWTRRVMLAADAASPGSDYPADADALGALFPPDYQVDRFYLGQVGIAPARDTLFMGLNQGYAYSHFVGHASHIGMGNGGLLTAFDLDLLDNGDRLPVVTMQTCLAAQFGHPGQERIGERLSVAPDKGAIAVWGASTLTLNSAARSLVRGFYEATFPTDPETMGELRIGEAILKAKKAYAASGGPDYLLDVYNLLGDPATEMK